MRCASCGEGLQARWEVCPMCATPRNAIPSAAPSGPEPTSSPLLPAAASALPPECRRDLLSHGIHRQLHRLLYPELFMQLEAFQAAEGASAMLRAWDVGQLSLALERAIEQLARLIAKIGEGSQIQVERKEVLERLELESRGLARSLEHFSVSLEQLRDIELPDDALEGFVQGVAERWKKPTDVAASRIAGAALGTLIAPGLGTALGAFIGGWVARRSIDEDRQELLSCFERTYRQLLEAYDEAFRLFYEAIVQLLEPHVPAGLKQLHQLEEEESFANRVIEEAITLVDQAGAHDAALLALEDALGSYPNHRRLLLVTARVLLLSSFHHQARTLLMRGLSLFPESSDYMEVLADVALAQKQPHEARRWLDKGLALNPQHPGLLLSLAQCLEALGDLPGALRSYQLLHQRHLDEPRYLYQIARIRALQGDIDGSLRALFQLRDLGFQMPQVLPLLQGEPAFAPLLKEPRLAGIAASPIQQLHERIRGFFDSDFSSFYLPEHVDAAKLSNARGTFLVTWPERAETLLLFVDTTLFGSAKDGLALTDVALYYRNIWAPTYRVEYREIDSSQIAYDNDASTLTLHTFDGEVHHLNSLQQRSADLARCLIALIQTLYPQEI